MSRAKPTLGYPTRTAAIIALRKEGASNDEIAEQIGISPGTVAALINSYNRSGKRDGRITVSFTRDQFDELERQAGARGCEVAHLITRIVGITVSEGLVGAVLDDGVST